jgi:hypothetical protein
VGQVTQYGYVRSTLQDLLTSLKTNVRNKLGADWNVETGSLEDQFLSVFAEPLDQVEQGIEGVVAAQTLAGAEGVYLDDLLGQKGVYRKGKTAGGGQVVFFSDYSTVILNSTISTNTLISALNNLTYQVEQDIAIDNFMSCYKLSASQLSIGTQYTFTAYNSNDVRTTTFTYTPISDGDKDRMLRSLAVFINDNVSNQPTQTFFDVTTRTMFVGHNSTTLLPETFTNGSLYLSATPRIGYIGHKTSIIALTKGFYPLQANGLVGVSPTYIGYNSVVNPIELNSGTEVQTDAEYLLADKSVVVQSLAGTPDSLKSGLLALEGVIDAEVYENPTSSFIYDVSGNTVCAPYRYNVVVLGGDDNEVAQVIYEKGYGNTQRTGSYVVTARNYKDTTVNVNFTRCGYFDIAVDIKYKTKDGSALTESEKSNIISTLTSAISEFSIGDYVSVNLLEAITYQSVGFARLKSANVSLKDLTVVGGSFSAEDLLADYDEKPRVSANNITFERLP